MLWMGIVVDLLQVLWHILDPRMHRGIVARGVDWLGSMTLGLWLTWIVGIPGIEVVSSVLVLARSTVVIEAPAWPVDSVDIPGSRVLLVPTVSVDSVDSMVSVGSVMSSCLG